MEALWISTALVAIAEIGDKTQLLAIILAARYRKPVPIILGILAATLLNHAAAAAGSALIAQFLSGPAFQIAVGAAFIVMAAWALIPDKQDDAAVQKTASSVFLTTLIVFFIVEIGDKTQIATTLLAARFQDIILVTIGTTLGMMIANVPAVIFGERITRIIPMNYVRIAAAAIFAVIGIWILAAALV